MSGNGGGGSSEAEAMYARATRLELDGSFDGAFKLYIKAAGEFIRVSRSTQDPAFRERIKADASRALQRAEQIKLRKQNVITPVAKDHFAEGEQLLVLQKSSVVHGVPYPLWTDGALNQHDDIAQPALSAEQLEHSASWSQVSNADYALYNEGKSLCARDIIQHVISDCSLCASVAVCVEHNRRLGSKLMVSSLYPQDSGGLPSRSSSEIHSLRILFNGSHRKACLFLYLSASGRCVMGLTYRHSACRQLPAVAFDDKLPTYPDGTLMCMSTGSKRELWPSFIEKAYMKLMGGYAFPGSHSTTDLYTLTGWIPETLEISSPGFERERTWKRISSAFREGRCLLTVGTARELPEEAFLPIKLLPAHCYAVIDLVDDGDERYVTVLDNWIETSSVESEMAQLSFEDRTDRRPSTCNVTWDVLCTVFDGIFLNWDPAMFEHQLQFHGMWRKDDKLDPNLPRNFNVRLSVSEGPDTDVWLLLTRHIVDLKREPEFIAMSAQVEDELVSNLGDLSMKGAFTNNTHVLVKARCVNAILSISASYDGPYDAVGFTISAYASSPLSWVPSNTDLLYNAKASGAITSKSAGGNPSSPTFMNNPQYHLRIHPEKSARGQDASTTKSRIALSLTGDRRIPFNVTIVWSQGQRITELASNDVAVSTGPYRYGQASAAKSLPPGDYTVIISSFYARKTGAYFLNVDSSTQIDLSPIAQEGAGMFSKVVRGAWDAQTAAGGPSFKKYTSNPVYELKIPAQSQVRIRLQLENPDSTVAVNVTIFRVTSRHTLGPHISTSGPYSDALSGVVTPQVTLQQGSYLVIPSTFTPGVQCVFKLLIYTSISGVDIEPIAVALH